MTRADATEWLCALGPDPRIMVRARGPKCAVRSGTIVLKALHSVDFTSRAQVDWAIAALTTARAVAWPEEAGVLQAQHDQATALHQKSPWRQEVLRRGRPRRPEARGFLSGGLLESTLGDDAGNNFLCKAPGYHT